MPKSLDFYLEFTKELWENLEQVVTWFSLTWKIWWCWEWPGCVDMIVCLNVMFLCSWGVARGSEVLSGGVTQSRDDWSSSSSQGEWREVGSCESHSGGIFCLFLWWKWRWVCYLKTSVSIAFCGSRTSIKSASHGPHPALCRGASNQNVLAPVDWRQFLRTALLCSDLACCWVRTPVSGAGLDRKAVRSCLWECN